jgi:amidase
MHYLTLTELAESIATRKVSPVEVCAAMLARIERLDPELHAYTTVSADTAMAQARRAEAELESGAPSRRLHGVPIAVKDLCDTAGIRTTAGMSIFADRVPTTNATIVQRLLDAGAVLLGKATTTEGAGVLHHPSVLPPINPWSREHWSGASSSGSGVATAAGLCFGAIGTDTAGSIRFPSSCNGVVGLKPTFGRVPKDGVFPLGPSLDHVGPMTRSVRDAARMLQVLAGPDPKDLMAARVAVDDYEAEIDAGVRGLRIGVDETYCRRNVEPDLSNAILAAAAQLEKLGAVLCPVEVDGLDAAVDACVVIFHAEAAAVHRRLFAQYPDRYGPHFRGLVEVGLRISGVDYANAHEARLLFRGRLDALLEGVDALLCPPSISAALPAAAMLAAPVDFGDIKFTLPYTMPYNLAGTPTLTLPCGFRQDGVPLAMQLVGPHFREARLLRIGHAYQQATEWHRRHPSF